jgi:hypothetical protein
VPSNRKRFWIRKTDQPLIKKAAEMLGLPSASALGRAWIESYIKHGTDYRRPEMVELQVVIPEGLVAQANERAESEGITLKDVIDHEIEQLRQL